MRIGTSRTLFSVEFKFLLIPAMFILLRMWSLISNICFIYIGINYNKLSPRITTTLDYFTVSTVLINVGAVNIIYIGGCCKHGYLHFQGKIAPSNFPPQIRHCSCPSLTWPHLLESRRGLATAHHMATPLGKSEQSGHTYILFCSQKSCGRTFNVLLMGM